MKKLQLILSTLLAAAAFAAPFKVVGFYPYWAQYSQFYPKDIRYNTVTHIHYMSLLPSEDGSLAYADENDSQNFEALAKAAQENQVSLVVSIGGYEAEGALSAIGDDESKLSKFCENAMEWVDKYNLAGLELDWQNFESDNAKALKAIAKALKSKLGDKSLSVMAYAASADAYGDALAENVDYVTVSIGDQMDESSESVKPNMSKQDVENAVKAFTDKSVDAGKIVPIVPLYGKTFAGAKGLGSSHQGVGSGNEGYLPYRELMGKFDTPDYKVSFDEASGSEVAVSDAETIVFSGIPSMKAVANFVKDNSLAGVAVYDLSQDHHEPIVSLLVTIGLVLRPEVDYKPKKK
jgi:GH18 family chitinase